MTKKPEEYVVRRPRHHASDSPAVGVCVERGPGGVPGSIRVELVDLSRMGARLRSPVPLAETEKITVRLYDDKGAPRLVRSATVRWACPDRRDTWAIGCQFSAPLDWETLGELFLDRVLWAKATPPPNREPVPPASLDAADEPCLAPPIERHSGA